MHESLADRDKVRPGSTRSFGFVFAAVFGLIALFPLLYLHPPRLWALAVAGAFLLAALVRPSLLTRPNELWFRFGLLLHRIVNPLVLGLLFFIVIVPVSLILRALKVKLLSLSYDANLQTYWVARTSSGSDPTSFSKQF